METVEVVGANTFVVRTRQLGPHSWSCDIYEKHEGTGSEEIFVLGEFGESELEAFAMALSDAVH